jgi:hypothetical protein
MGLPTTRVRLRTLVVQELRALPRNTFALGTLAVVLGLLAIPTSFLIAGEGGLDETLVFTWFILPLVVAVIVAARVAGARRTRFVDSLYTTPLTQTTWFAAQAIVGATLALLALAIQVPFLIVFMAWLGVPAFLPAAALAGLGIAAFAVALGLFCGVVVGDSSPLAAAGLAGGLAFASFILFLVHSIVLTEAPSTTRDVLLYFTALSPIALATDASGLGIAGQEPTDAWQPALGVLGLTAGLAAAAWLAYTRSQSPLGWEPGAGGRAAVAVAVLLAVAAPVAAAEVEFVDHSGDIGYDPGEHTWVAFVKPGSPATESSFTILSILSEPVLPVGRDVAYDVLVMALGPSDAAVKGVRIQVTGNEVLRVVDGGTLVVPTGAAETHVPAPNDGKARPVYRVPVTVRALTVQELGASAVPVAVHTEFNADGKRFVSDAQVYLTGKVAGAAGQLLAAGSVVPAAAAFGFVRRKRETR